MKAWITDSSEKGKVEKGIKSGSAKIDSIPFIKLLGRSQKKRFLKLVTNSFYANNYDPHLIRSKVTPLVKKLIEDYGLNLFIECIEQLRLPLYKEELQQVLDKNNYYMKQCKPTEKQLNFLNSLNYTGPKPETCYDASQIIANKVDNRPVCESNKVVITQSDSNRLFNIKLIRHFNKSQKKLFFETVIKMFDKSQFSKADIYDAMSDDLQDIIKEVGSQSFMDCIDKLYSEKNKAIIIKYISDNKRNKVSDHPTEKQLQFLISLKYDGPIPKNKLEASKIIDDCLSYKKMYGKR